MSEWLTTPAFADIAGIKRRAAAKALGRAITGSAWNGLMLEVRAVEGRGGRSGKCYEVALSSFSEALQNAFWEAAGCRDVQPDGASNVPACLDAMPRVMPNTSQGKKIAQLLDAIGPALAHPRNSTARADAIRAAVRPGLALRTLQRFVSEYEAADYDLTRLGRRRPADAGERRVWVSREFDRAYLAAGHDPERLPHWGARRDQLLKDWWASPVQRAGGRRVQLEVQTALRVELAADGVVLPKAAVLVSQRAVMATQHYREVDEYAHNRKVWDDGKTRIRRDNSQWRPLEQVVLDVKHLWRATTGQ